MVKDKIEWKGRDIDVFPVKLQAFVIQKRGYPQGTPTSELRYVYLTKASYNRAVKRFIRDKLNSI